MGMPEFTKDMNIIQKLNDEPNDRDGLTAGELKAKFDEGGLALKQYLNNTVGPYVEGMETAEQDHEADTVKHITAAERAAWNNKVDQEEGKGLSTNDFTDAAKNKLNGIAAGAEVNQNAFSNVKVGSITIAADSKTDTLTLAAGSNVTLSVNASSGTVTIVAKDTTYESKAAASGGTAVSLVTTGEKYRWNSKAEGVHTHEVDDMPGLLNAVRYGPAGAVTIEDAGGGLPIKSLVATILPVQLWSGTPSPDNVRPISGWTGARITQARANLWTGEQMLADIKRALPNATVTGTVIAFNASGALGKIFLANGFKENTQYTLILRYTNTAVSGAEGYCRPNVAIVYTDGTYEGLIAQGFTANEFKTVAFHSVEGKTIDYIVGSNNYARSSIDTAESGLFEGYLTVDDFEAFDGETIDYEFPAEAGTVYGGTLDVLTGTLTVDRKGYVFDGTENWSQMWSAPNKCFRLVVSGTQVRIRDDRASSHFANVQIISGTTAVGYYAYNGTASAVYIQFRPNLTDIPDLASWKAWLAAQHQAGTPLTCWHTIEALEIYQLTPKEVLSTLAGTNNLWCNAGEVTVEYGAFLRALQAEAEALQQRKLDITALAEALQELGS